MVAEVEGRTVLARLPASRGFWLGSTGPSWSLHLVDTHLEEALRPIANRAVYAIALMQTGPGLVPHWNVLRALGFASLAMRIAERVSVVRIEEADALTYRVTVPQKDLRWKVLVLAGAKAGEEKSVLLPRGEKPALCKLLLSEVPEQMGQGPKGLFVVRRGWKAPPKVDLSHLRKVGERLQKSQDPEVQKHGARLADFAAMSGVEVDWRPAYAIPEDVYAA